MFSTDHYAFELVVDFIVFKIKILANYSSNHNYIIIVVKALNI